MRKNRLMFHLKKAVSNFDSRPALKCVQYNKNGNLYATDSHVAVRINNFHDGSNEFTLDISTMEIGQHSYPDVERLMKVENIKCEAEFVIPTFIKAIKPFADKSNITPTVKMTIANGLMTLESQDHGFEKGLKIEFPLEDVEGEIVISANPIYILQALEFARDADTAIPPAEKKKNGVVRVKFGSDIRPFMFTVGNYDYLLTDRKSVV